MACAENPNDAQVDEPWPADALWKNPDGSLQVMPGWDSRAPLTWVLEHPGMCHLVPPEETTPIGEWAIFSVERYSDACDYVMT